MSNLPPAYRGAPYWQPPPRTRKQRIWRTVLIAGVAASVLLVVVLIGAVVAHSNGP
jgi:hypothetical protein